MNGSRDSSDSGAGGSEAETATSSSQVEMLVPDDVLPHQNLPPLRYRDLPEAPGWKQLVGPSIILAGLALGSGEFVFWPYITYKSGFVFFWACMLGVATQFFINLEIERWTLATGESAITGFCRLSRHWAWIMLILNVIPWMWPGWATGASTLATWLFSGHAEHGGGTGAAAAWARYVPYLAVGTLWLIGIVLTAGPVVYNTVERVQTILVGLIVVIALGLGVYLIRWDALVAMCEGISHFGQMPPLSAGLDQMALLGALAFAGAGGTMNLGQSNFIKDKGYGMGRYIGRITSPLTGNPEPIADVGYHFPDTPENRRRWQDWWRAANIEHFFSFYLTCVVCLVLLALISYSLFYDATGHLKPGMERFTKDMDFVWGEAAEIERLAQISTGGYGRVFSSLFLIMGMALLLTTELGVLDATARISTDIIKVNFLRDNPRWTLGRLYFLILWGEIALSSGILIASALVPRLTQPLFLLKTAAAMNGGVMFLYSLLLLYLNLKILRRSLAMGWVRFVVMVWSSAFFGYFTLMAVRLELWPYFRGWF